MKIDSGKVELLIKESGLTRGQLVDMGILHEENAVCSARLHREEKERLLDYCRRNRVSMSGHVRSLLEYGLSHPAEILRIRLRQVPSSDSENINFCITDEMKNKLKDTLYECCVLNGDPRDAPVSGSAFVRRCVVRFLNEGMEGENADVRCVP